MRGSPPCTFGSGTGALLLSVSSSRAGQRTLLLRVPGWGTSECSWEMTVTPGVLWLGGKSQVCEEFGKAMEKDDRSALKKTLTPLEEEATLSWRC